MVASQFIGWNTMFFFMCVCAYIKIISYICNEKSLFTMREVTLKINESQVYKINEI